ncbi:cyclin-domain-containing protein [Aspergillus californicus]
MNGGSAEDEPQVLPQDTSTQNMPELRYTHKEAENNPGVNYKMDVFELSPDTALEFLCVAMDKLAEVSSAQKADASAPGLGGGDIISSGEETPTRITELHFSPMGDQPLGRDHLQQSVLSKRFLSKREPPIALKDYLLRLHRYCPMSTGVYLAASLYINRMANIDRAILVNRKNIHRLVLAGLRVAMKTLEDLSYSHSRVAKVGGVTNRELTKLEISFCFLADFELRVDKDLLSDQAILLQSNMTYGTGLDQET